MAAPGAIVISKILYPQTEEINTDVKVSSEKIGSNILDAIANGTTEGLKLAVNVGQCYWFLLPLSLCLMVF